MQVNIGHIGMDPEVAIVSKKTGKGRSAHLFVNEPQQFVFTTADDEMDPHFDRDEYYDEDYGYYDEPDETLGSEYDRDGAAIEIRTLVATACRDNLIPYAAEAIRQAYLRVQNVNDRFVLSSTPKFELDKQSLEGNVPEDVLEFGCRPDIDAYSLEPKDPVCSPRDKRRWTGGHLHASRMGAANDVEQQAALALMFDYCVALPMVAILGEEFAGGEAERRTMYGQAGSFRYDDQLDKVEFRTLSGRLLVSPIVLGWAIGAMKSMVANVEQIYNPETYDYHADYKSFVMEYLLPVVDPKSVASIVNNHDVDGAEKFGPEVLRALPKFRERTSDLANAMSGGGYGTMNPYFYEQSLRGFIAANREGVTFKDDMQFTWGLYEDYKPKHHAYWGVQSAFAGLIDEDIFPQRPVVERLWPREAWQKSVMYTHPLNGGAKEWVDEDAPYWLS